MLHDPPFGVVTTLHPAQTDANLLANSLTRLLANFSTSQSGALLLQRPSHSRPGFLADMPPVQTYRRPYVRLRLYKLPSAAAA